MTKQDKEGQKLTTGATTSEARKAKGEKESIDEINKLLTSTSGETFTVISKMSSREQ